MAGGVQRSRTFDVGVTAPADEFVSSGTDTLTVVVWNISWGYGWGSEGTGARRGVEHFQGSVARVGEVLASLGADLALIQEIDFSSRRSGGFDQAELIAERAGLPWIARAPSWTANWVPFPYWPPREHFGRVHAGGAVLSRFPIARNSVRLLGKPAEYAWWYNLFYLFHYLQRCEVRIGGTVLEVFNTHLEAFKEGGRSAQARELRDVLEALSEAERARVLLGGDFNAVPLEATAKSNYPDETKVKTSHERDPTIEIIRGVAGLEDSCAADCTADLEAKFFTFPAHEPNRKLDHLFHGSAFEVVEARVAREAGDVSDHLPLVVKLRLKR